MPNSAYSLITDTILGQVQYLAKAIENPTVQQYGCIFKEETGVQFHSRWSAWKKGHTYKINSKKCVKAMNDVWFSLNLGVWNLIFYNTVEHLPSIKAIRGAHCESKKSRMMVGKPFAYSLNYSPTNSLVRRPQPSCPYQRHQGVSFLPIYK